MISIVESEINLLRLSENHSGFKKLKILIHNFLVYCVAGIVTLNSLGAAAAVAAEIAAEIAAEAAGVVPAAVPIVAPAGVAPKPAVEKMIPLTEVNIEIVVSPELNLDMVCQGIGPQFSSSGPWSFRLGSHLECSTGDPKASLKKRDKFHDWKIYVQYQNSLLSVSVCRRTNENKKIEEKCEASVTIPAKSNSEAISIFTSNTLMTVIAASLYDQLPVKSILQKKKVGYQKINLKEEPILSGFPKVFPQIIEGKVSLTRDGKTFKVEQSKKNDTSNNRWVISLSERGSQKELLQELIKKILIEQPPKKVEAPIGKFSAYSSLFPPTGSDSNNLPPTLFEIRVKAGFDKPMFGFKPNFEFGLRKMITYVDTNLITTSTDNQNTSNKQSMNKISEDNYYYYIGSNFKFLLIDLELEPSIALGVTHSKIKTQFSNKTITEDTSSFNASALKVGTAAKLKLFSIPLIGELSAEGALNSGFSKSPTYAQKWISASGGASLLIPQKLIPTWSHLAKVTLEGYGEVTALTTDWTWNQSDNQASLSVSSVPIVGIFGISSFWY